MDPVLEVAAARAFRDAGAASVEAGVVEATARHVHIFLGRLINRAATLSSGSMRSQGNARDIGAALCHHGISIESLRAVPRAGTRSIEIAVGAVETSEPEFTSVFAAPGPQLPHAVGPRFPPLPAAHHCMSTPQVTEARDDYVTVRKEQARERDEMLSALINLRIRTDGGIQIEGFPHLSVLRHTGSPPYPGKPKAVSASEVSTWATIPDVGGSLRTPLADSLFDTKDGDRRP